MTGLSGLCVFIWGAQPRFVFFFIFDGGGEGERGGGRGERGGGGGW